MKKRRQALQVSTFPFLAVLLCAMGSLILLLLVIDRRAKAVARAKAWQAILQAEAQETHMAAAHKAELERRQAELERRSRLLHTRLLEQEQELVLQVRTTLSQAETTAQSVLEDQTRVKETEAKIEEGKAELSRRKAEIETRRAELSQTAKLDEASRAELTRLAMELQKLERTLVDLKAVRQQRQESTYSLVPYRGRRGDTRRPLYVECTADGVIFHPDRLAVGGIDLAPKAIRDEVERRLAAQPPADSAAKKPYLLMLVRPNGIVNYYRALSALHGLQVDFGYEFIEQDWVLDFPKDDDSIVPQPWMAQATPSVLPPSSGPRPPPLPLRTHVTGTSPLGFNDTSTREGPWGKPGGSPGGAGGAGGTTGPYGGSTGQPGLAAGPGSGGPFAEGAAASPGGMGRLGIPSGVGSPGGVSAFPYGGSTGQVGVAAGSGPGPGGPFAQAAGTSPGGTGGPGIPGAGSFPNAPPDPTALMHGAVGRGAGGPGSFPVASGQPSAMASMGDANALPSGGSSGPAGAVAGAGPGSGGAYAPGAVAAAGGAGGPGVPGGGSIPNAPPDPTALLHGAAGGPGGPGVFPLVRNGQESARQVGGSGGASAPSQGVNAQAGSGYAPGPAGGGQGDLLVRGPDNGSTGPRGWNAVSSSPGDGPSAPPGSDAGLRVVEQPGNGQGAPPPVAGLAPPVPALMPAGNPLIPGGPGQTPPGQPFVSGQGGGNPGGSASSGAASTGRGIPGQGSGGAGGAEDDGEEHPASRMFAATASSDRPARPVARPGILRGNRDWVISIECRGDGVLLNPTRLPFKMASLEQGPANNPLLQMVRQMIDRRQASVYPGEPPYRPLIHFVVQPDGLRAYYTAYPILEQLNIPMSRTDVLPEKETKRVAG